MIKVYKNSVGNYVCGLWGGSTKHPDSVFHFEDFENLPTQTMMIIRFFSGYLSAQVINLIFLFTQKN